MSIISPLPYTIVNGSVIDANPVMADFNQIVNNVNSNAAAINGNSSVGFSVAPAVGGPEAVALSQLPGILSHSVMASVADCSATTLGYAQYNASTLNIPVAGTYGILLTVSNAGSPTPSGINWIFQFATDTNNNPTYRRQNINNGGWTAWVTP